MGMAEVVALAIGFGNWVAICDLDSRGTVSILTLLPLPQYSALVDDEDTELFMGSAGNSAGRHSFHPPLTVLRK